jgi:hypothetical protein
MADNKDRGKKLVLGIARRQGRADMHQHPG